MKPSAHGDFSDSIFLLCCKRAILLGDKWMDFNLLFTLDLVLNNNNDLLQQFSIVPKNWVYLFNILVICICLHFSTHKLWLTPVISYCLPVFLCPNPIKMFLAGKRKSIIWKHTNISHFFVARTSPKPAGNMPGSC